MNEKKTDLFEIAVELRGIAETCSLHSWMIGPDGCDGRMSMEHLHMSLDTISRHLNRIADEIEN